MTEAERALAEMDAYITQNETAGWPSPELERTARRLRFALWEGANNDPVHHTYAPYLAECATAFERAKFAALRNQSTC